HLRGEQDRLSAAVPYRNYVAQARLGVSAQEHEQFFKERLGDIEEPTAPFGLTEVRGDGQGIVEARLVVAPEIARGIRRCARIAGVSAASVCHLAWAQVLRRLTGREEVVVGTVLFGRMLGGAGAHSEQRRKAFEGISFLYAEERTNYPLALAVNDLGEGFSLDAQTHR